MLYLTCLILVLAALLVERFWLQRQRARVPIRIHIHGSRGKSTITRALAAILRAQGLRVLAKTTGDQPEYILPDGSVKAIRRIGPARIKEHIDLLMKAPSMGVEAVIVEGMAIQPETVFLSEEILQATHSVIANTRPDHAETMGAGREGVLQTLRHMIPSSGVLLTADETGAALLKELAARKNVPCSLVRAVPAEQPIALARAVAGALLPGKDLSQGWKSARYWPFSRPHIIESCGMPVCLYDFLSANDVVSSQLLLEGCSLCPDYFTVALLATRADRPLRTRDFMRWILAEARIDAVAVMGSHAGFTLVIGHRERFRDRFLRVRPWLCPERLLAVMRKEALRKGRNGLTVVALGNFHGYGEQWRTALQQPKEFAYGSERDAKPNTRQKKC